MRGGGNHRDPRVTRLQTVPHLPREPPRRRRDAQTAFDNGGALPSQGRAEAGGGRGCGRGEWPEAEGRGKGEDRS